MSRNVVLPLLGLIGIVFFSLNRLARPVDVEGGGPAVLEAVREAEPPPERAFMATPPPAPKLASALEAESAALEAEADSAGVAAPDSSGAVAVEDDGDGG